MIQKNSGNVYKYGRTIPEFVKNLRGELNLSQRDLAKHLGIHSQYVSNVERGMYDNPLSFCSMLYSVVDKDRAIYLTDLVAENLTMNAMDRMAGRIKKKQLKKKKND